MNLYPFQEQAVAFHLAHHYSINASEMGLGKTMMALASAIRANAKPLVIGPAFLARTWKDEAAKVGIEIEYVAYSMLHKLSIAQAKKFKFWICDEAHALKSPTTQRTSLFYSLLKNCLPTYCLFLTGTPIKNRAPDFWTLLGFCGVNPKKTSGKALEGEFAKYHGFARYFCSVSEMRIHGRSFVKYNDVRPDRINELKSYLTDKFIRFRVEDVLQDLPPITRKDVLVDLTIPDDAGLRATFEAYVLGRKADTVAKVRSATLKAHHTVRYVRDLFEGGSGPLVIFSDHIEPTQIIAEGLGDGALAITGKMPAELRADAVARFQKGQIDYLVATIGSLSVGVTLTRSRHVIFNDPPWVPADLLQAEKRVHRIGQDHACWSHFIDATPTDKYIRKTLLEKLDTIGKVYT